MGSKTMCNACGVQWSRFTAGMSDAEVRGYAARLGPLCCHSVCPAQLCGAGASYYASYYT
jgi:hypothetical protein